MIRIQVGESVGLLVVIIGGGSDSMGLLVVGMSVFVGFIGIKVGGRSGGMSSFIGFNDGLRVGSSDDGLRVGSSDDGGIVGSSDDGGRVGSSDDGGRVGSSDDGGIVGSSDDGERVL